MVYEIFCFSSKTYGVVGVRYNNVRDNGLQLLTNLFKNIYNYYATHL